MFKQAHEENCKQLELEKKKVEKESKIEKLNISASPETGNLLHMLQSSNKIKQLSAQKPGTFSSGKNNEESLT